MREVDWSALAVLVVDDDPDVRALVVRSLGEFGVGRVLEAGDGEEALGVLGAEGPVDLIVCDLDMPAMDGVAFVRALRADPDPAVAATPVLVVSGRGEDDGGDAVAALGVQGYLVKPVPKGLLRARIAAALVAG